MNLHVNVEHLEYIMPIQQGVYISQTGEAELMTDSEEKSDILTSSPSMSESSDGKVSICVYLYMCACLSVCLPACLSVCLSAHLSVCQSIHLSFCLSVRLSLCACLLACLPANQLV